MSDMSEYYIEQEINEMIRLDFTKMSILTHNWETKDKRHIAISSMTTSHIENSLAKCIRDEWRTEFIPLFREELENRKGLFK